MLRNMFSPLLHQDAKGNWLHRQRDTCESEPGIRGPEVGEATRPSYHHGGL